MKASEHYLAIDCLGSKMHSILHKPSMSNSIGIVFVVGGPQYRIGSHRQFLLLARKFAHEGYPVLRFDYRGMGESGGTVRTFENINEDIKAVVDCLKSEISGLEKVVLWGLCDAATAISFYAHHDDRVVGTVMLNPWVRSAKGEAKAFIRNYYAKRLFSLEFIRKIVSGKYNLSDSLSSFLRNLLASLNLNTKAVKKIDIEKELLVPLHEKLLNGLNQFNGKMLFILCEDDLTAAEFSQAVKGNKIWNNLNNSDRMQLYTLAGANHTFSKRIWRDSVAEWTLNWMKSL